MQHPEQLRYTCSEHGFVLYYRGRPIGSYRQEPGKKKFIPALRSLAEANIKAMRAGCGDPQYVQAADKVDKEIALLEAQAKAKQKSAWLDPHICPPETYSGIKVSENRTGRFIYVLGYTERYGAKLYVRVKFKKRPNVCPEARKDGKWQWLGGRGPSLWQPVKDYPI